MPLDFSCPHCGATTIVEDQYCGHTGPCFSCGKSVTVPFNPASAAVGSATASHLRRQRRSVLPVIIVVMAGILAAIITGVLVVAIAIPGIRTVRHSTQRSTCRNNLQAIGRALVQYHQQYGSFPPAYVPDENGKPMHSWRVLILPQLNETALYRQYRFDRPWDAPENQIVAAKLPDVYACPSNTDANLARETSYMVVAGPRTAFPDKAGTSRMDQFTDPLAETILVVEVAASGVNWTEPKDLDATQLRLAINPGKSSVNSISSEHSGGVHALFADGRVHWLNNGLPLESISAALTRNGGDAVDWAQLEDE